MAHSVEMPELGESVTEGTVTQWLKKVGDKVEVDEPLLEVSTDKVDTEIPSPVAGVLLKILADEDDTVDVGTVIAEIGDEGEEASSDDDAKESSDEGSAGDDASDEDTADSSAAEGADSKSSDDNAGSGEAEDVKMPELGESVTEGTITQWLKKVGDKVEVDEPLLEVSTDKVDTEVPSPVAGTLVEILAEEDDTVDVGEVIARVGDGSAKPSKEDKKSDDGKSEDESDKAVAEDKAASKKDVPSSADSESSDDNAGSGEAEDVKMPELGESVTEGTITQWLKKVGDKVEVDEPLLEVSTDKVDTEVPSPVAGTLVEILAEEDDTVDVGEVIARVGDGSAKPSKEDKKSDEDESKKEAEKSEPKKAEKTAEDKSAEKKEDKPAKSEAASGKSSTSTNKPGEGNLPYVTPLVRKLADKHEVDLSTIKGTGVGGRIRKQDVLAAANGGGAATASSAAEQSPAGTRLHSPS